MRTPNFSVNLIPTGVEPNELEEMQSDFNDALELAKDAMLRCDSIQADYDNLVDFARKGFASRDAEIQKLNAQIEHLRGQ